MSNRPSRGFLRDLIVVAATLIVGVEVLSGLAQVVQSWISVTDTVAHAIGLDPASNTGLYLLLYLIPLLVVLYVLGACTAWIRSIINDKTALADAPETASADAVRPQHRSGQDQSQQADRREAGQDLNGPTRRGLSGLGNDAFQGFEDAVRSRPRLFVTVALMVVTLVIVNLELPEFFVVSIGLALGATFIISVPLAVTSIVVSDTQPSLGVQKWVALYSAVCFVGYVAFQASAIRQVIDPLVGPLVVANQPSNAPPPTTVVKPSNSNLLQQVSDLLKVKEPTDAIRSSFIVFAVMFGVAGFGASKNSPMMGLFLGGVAGGAFGLLIGAIASAAMVAGNTLAGVIAH